MKRFFNIMLVYLVIFLAGSCKKEEETRSTFVIINQTDVNISIAPTTSMSDTLKIAKGQILEERMGIERGITPGIGGAYFADGGPVIVIFDNQYQVIHYRDSLTHLYKFLNQLSSRCFYNTNSFLKEIRDNDKKTSRQVKLTYIFTNSDYEFAK